MKRIALFLLALLSCIKISAQEYKEMLTEGKSWKIMVVYGANNVGYLTYKVSGDTIVKEKKCKRILALDQENLGNTYNNLAAYEENQKLYSFDDNDEPQVFLDFTKGAGDCFYNSDAFEDDNPKVQDVGYITVRGTTRKRITFTNNSCWVEGIGTNQGIWPCLIGYSGEREFLMECYDNDNLVFTQADFGVTLSVSGIPQDAGNKGGGIYSIDGMKLTETPNKGIYITDGKKIAK